MLTMQRPVDPFPLQDRNMDDFYDLAQVIATERRLSSSSSERRKTPSLRRESSTRSNDKFAVKKPRSRQMSSSTQLRLAELAKQHVMARHVENWREDMLPVRFHLPMQHVIGSLRRDEDELVNFQDFDDVSCNTNQQMPMLHPMSPFPATPADSEDSFLQMIRSPISAPSISTASTVSSPDADNLYAHHSPEHIAKDIPQAALPGLNMALNVATITPSERDLFTEYAPQDLEDPQTLMSEVLKLRSEMMASTDDESETKEVKIEPAHFNDFISNEKVFDDFVDFDEMITFAP